jgi:hypothetical protein
MGKNLGIAGIEMRYDFLTYNAVFKIMCGWRLYENWFVSAVFKLSGAGNRKKQKDNFFRF